MNNVVLMGRLTRDPEIRYTASGKPVCQFTLAVQRNYKNKEGNYDADFINIVMWGSNGERLSNTVNKGQRVLINGQIQVRSYTNKDGATVYTTDVVADRVEFLEWGDRPSGQGSSSGQQYRAQAVDEAPEGFAAIDEDIPF